MPTHLRLDGLLFGVPLGYYYHFEPAKFAANAQGKGGLFICTLAVLMASIVPLNSPIMHTFGFTLLYLGFGLLLCKVIDAKPRRFLAPVARLGYYSYSIYLWHSWACRLLPRTTLWEYVLAFVAAIVPGIIMSHLIEIPLLALRDRLFHQATEGHQTVRSLPPVGFVAG
jgi:peptidoglycan/LPS O-acetylase OafA/YrhL